MSWRINCLENNLFVPEKAVDELFEVCNDYWYDKSEILDEDSWLRLNEDAMEHMDIVGDFEIQAILKKYKAQGSILFGSLDGDNTGDFWGYKFDGKGGMTELKGTISWKKK